MTSSATVLGAVPLAIATGAGAESRSAIGWVVVGGLSIGTLFTLFVIPVAYTFIAGERERIVEEGAGGAAVPPAGVPASRA